MSEESDLEKTEPATPRRLEKAREDGQVARSRELNTFLLLTAGVALLWVTGERLYHRLVAVLRAGLWFDPRAANDTQAMLDIAAHSALQSVLVLLPIFGVLVLVAILASISLGGLLFSVKALEFKGSRLSPLKGIKRMASAQTAIELLKTLAKAAVVGLVAALVIAHFKDAMIALMYANPVQALTGGMQLVALCCALIVAALLLIVMIDAPWQLYSHHKKMRMSQHEVKQEHKENEGDPHVKSHIRQQQRTMSRRRMMTRVPDADVVITNPTRYAVALQYQDGHGDAPRVVAKGTGLVAERIRAIAQEHRIPMLEAAPLARALYHHVDLEQEIPGSLYTAVAEALAWAYQLRGWAAGKGTPPTAPSSVVIPPGLDPAGQRETDRSHYE